MANLKNVVYISAENYATLVETGSITVGGVTYNYDENDLYLVPTAPYDGVSGTHDGTN